MFLENDSRFKQPEHPEPPLSEPPEPLRRIRIGAGKTPKYKSGSSAWRRRQRESVLLQHDPHYRAWRDPLLAKKQQEVEEAESKQMERLITIDTGNLPIQTHAQKWSAEEVATLHRVAAETQINSGPKLARLLAPVLGRSVSAVKNAIFHYRVLEGLQELKHG